MTCESVSDDYLLDVQAYNYLEWARSRDEVPKPGEKLVVRVILPQTTDDTSQPDHKYSHATLVDCCHQLPATSLFQPSLDYSYTNCAFIPSVSQETLNSTALEQGSLKDDPPSSTPEQKRNMFRAYLTVISSCVYAVFIVTLGVVIYISDIILGHTPLAESFSIYLVMVGLIYLLFLYIDIRRSVREVKERKAMLRIGDSDDSLRGVKGHDGDLHAWGPESLSKSDPSSWSSTDSPVQLDYCFSTGRHSGSFYLKCGAAGFCFGHLIHSGLLMGYQIVFLTAENDNDFYGCASVPTLVLDIIYPLYSFFQLFFIFKYSNVIINRCKELARFALMHCIASSICFWVWTILRETMDSLHHYAAAKDKMASARNAEEEPVESLENIMALPLVSYKQRGAEELLRFLNDSSKLTNQCLEPNGLTLISENFSPYLYPFTIEYSILVVGILFIIWQNIGNCCTPDSHCGCSVAESEESNMVIHADCHSANKGLFAGLIVFVGSVVSIIIFCVAMADSQYIELGLTVNVTSELALLVLMTITVIFAYRRVTQLDVNLHPISLLDDLLLFICIPAFFLYAIFSIVPAVERSNYLSITRILLQVIQVLLQTPFIIDGLRRCSNSRALRLEKPGRELVTFLIVCNVAMWVTETFEIKSHAVEDDRYDVYGKVLWTIVSHMTVPLTMFYRFHSSVCLADMWKSAYERGQ